jgi:hypothetical protein
MVESWMKLTCPSPGCNRHFVWEVSKYKIQCGMGHVWTKREAEMRQGSGRFLAVDRGEDAE